MSTALQPTPMGRSRRPGLAWLAALGLSGCDGVRLAVHEPDAFPVPLDDVHGALLVSADILVGFEGLESPWTGALAEVPGFWDTLTTDSGALGTARVVLGDHDLDCAQLLDGGVPAVGSGLILKWAWWQEEGQFPGWTGDYSTDGYVMDGDAARAAQLGVWEDGSWATLDYGSFDVRINRVDEDLVTAKVSSPLLDLAFDADLCVPPETQVEAP